MTILDLLRSAWRLIVSASSEGERPSELAVRLCQLEDWKRGKRGLSRGDLRYWSTRFRDRQIEARLGCSFESYLQRPLYYERLGQSRPIIDDQQTAHSKP